jgi:hypothetical protein
MKKVFITFCLLFINQIFSQDKNYTNPEKAFIEIFGKCFNDFKPIEGTKDFFTSKKDGQFCSLYQCVSRISYTEKKKDIQAEILKRALEITALLYNEGTPIYLISGMGSFGKADEKNEILTDDNNLIYISIADCISTNPLNNIMKVVNDETSRLLNLKNISN